jgi:hypothetical protein
MNSHSDVCLRTDFVISKEIKSDLVDRLLQLAKSLENEFGEKFTVIGLEARNAKLRSLPMSERQFQKAFDGLRIGEVNSVSLFGESKVIAKGHPRLIMACEVDGSSHGRIFIQSNAKQLRNNLKRRRAWSITLLHSLDKLVEIREFFVTRMEDRKLPYFYFANNFTDGLSFKETLTLVAWENYLEDKSTKLRGLFWGNLLNKNHLKPHGQNRVIMQLQEILGESNVLTLSSGGVFFTLPKSTTIKHKVEDLLNDFHLLITPRSQDIKEAREIHSI